MSEITVMTEITEIAECVDYYKEFAFRDYKIILAMTDSVPWINIVEGCFRYNYIYKGPKNSFKWFNKMIQVFENQSENLRNIEYHNTYLNIILTEKFHKENNISERLSMDKHDFPMDCLLKNHHQVQILKSELENSNKRIEKLENMINQLMQKNI